MKFFKKRKLKKKKKLNISKLDKNSLLNKSRIDRVCLKEQIDVFVLCIHLAQAAIFFVYE